MHTDELALLKKKNCSFLAMSNTQVFANDVCFNGSIESLHTKLAKARSLDEAISTQISVQLVDARVHSSSVLVFYHC